MTSPLTVLVFGAAVVAAVLTAAALGVRRIPGTRWFALLMTGVALWAATSGMQLVAGAETVRFWHTAKYLGVVVTVGAWFGFAVAYAGLSERVPRWTLSLLAVEPLAVLGLAVTNGTHELLWTAKHVVTEEGVTVVTSTYGPFFWVHTVYSYVLLTSATLVLLWTFHRRDLYRRQVVALLVGLALPWVANVLHLLDASPTAPVDPTSLAFTGTGLLFAAAVGRLRFLDAMPVVRELARDAALEDMTAGAVILDRHGHVVDANAAAVGLLGRPRRALLDRPFSALLPAVDSEDAGGGVADVTVTDSRGVAVGSGIVDVDAAGGRRHLRVESSPVNAYGGRTIGRLVTLHDVTERLIREQRLEVQNRVLRHNLRNDMNVILGHLDGLATDLDDSGHREEVALCREKGAHLVDQSEKARTVDRVLAGSTVRELDLGDAVGRVVDDCRAAHPAATVTATVPSGTHVRADESLPEALGELVENAVRHGEGAVEVVVSAGEDAVSVAVHDDGPGIPDHERAVLTAGRETALQHSSGLGLWLVKWAVTRSGGTLDICDGRSRGSVVTVSVPRA